MSKDKLGIAGVLAVLLGLGAGGWWFLNDAPPETVPAAERTGTPSVDRPAHLPLDPSPVEAAARREDTPVAAPTTQGSVASPSVPPSYEAALAGITGRLVEEDGVPVPDLPVTLLEFDFAQFPADFSQAFLDAPTPPRLEVAQAVSDAEGRFHLGGALASSFHGLGIDLGGSRGGLHIIEQALHSAETVDLGDIVLGAVVTFTGTVVDESSRPIAGARVRATVLPALIAGLGLEQIRRDCALIVEPGDEDIVFELPEWILKWESRLPLPTTHTDREGKFRLTGVPQGLVTTILDKPGRLSVLHGPRPSGQGAERDVGSLLLPAGRTFRGRVLDASRQPVVGAEVRAGVVSPIGEFALVQLAPPTDTDGRFSIPGMPLTGAPIYAVRTHATAAWKVLGPPNADEDIEFQVEDSVTLTVLLRDRQDRIVPDAEVRVRPDWANGEFFPLTMSPFHALPADVARVQDGQIEIHGLQPGRYFLVGQAPGFATALIEAEAAPGAPAVELVFSNARDLEVRVVEDTSGDAVEHAHVQAVIDEIMSPAIASARTDEAGHALLRNLPIGDPEATFLRVEHPAYARFVVPLDAVMLPGDLGELTVTLLPGNTVEGTLVENGGIPQKRYLVSVFLHWDSRQLRDPADNVPFLALTDGEGHFRLTGLREGRYGYEVYERFLQGNLLEGVESRFPPREVDDGTFQVAAGEVTELVIALGQEGPPAHLSGEIWNNGRPAESMQINTHGEKSAHRRHARTDAQGRFDLGEIRAGTVTVYVLDKRDGSYHSVYNESLELVPGEYRELRIMLESYSVPIQVVRAADGKPVEGAEIQAFESDGENRRRSSGRARTDAEGRATLSTRGLGDIQFRVKHSVEGICEAQHTILRDMHEPLRFELVKGVVCAGEVILEGGLESSPDFGVFLNIWQDPKATEVLPLHQSVQIQPNETHFHVAGLQAGRYFASIYTDGGQSEAVEFELPAHGDERLVLRFRPRSDPN